MEYNKNQYRKVACKKVLHKINKSWVTVSVALLGMLGGGALVHANEANAASVNHSTTADQTKVQSNHAQQTGSQSAQLIKPASQSNAVSKAVSSRTGQISQAATSLQGRIVQHVNSSSASTDQQSASHSTASGMIGHSAANQSQSNLQNSSAAVLASAHLLRADAADQGQQGTITLQYLLNNKLVYQDVLHRRVGRDFSLTEYLAHAPKGLKIKQVLGNGDEIFSFTKNPQVIKIAVSKFVAPQTVHVTLQYIDVSNHDIVKTDHLAGPLGERIDYGKYEAQAPLGFQFDRIGRSADTYLEDGDVDDLLVKEVNSGPASDDNSSNGSSGSSSSNKSSSSSSNNINSGSHSASNSAHSASSNSVSNNVSADSSARTQFSSAWTLAQQNLNNDHLQTDSAVASQLKSDQGLLDRNFGAFQLAMSANPVDLNKASSAVQTVGSVAQNLSGLDSAADASFVSAQDIQSLSASVSVRVSAAQADLSADGQRISIVAETVGSVSATVQSLVIAHSDNPEIANDQAQVLSAASLINHLQDSLTSASQALNTVAGQTVDSSDLSGVSSLTSSIASYDYTAGMMVQQVNQADVQMTQAASAASAAGQIPQPGQDQVVISYENPDNPQQLFSPKILSHVDVQRFSEQLIDHLISGNAADLLADDQDFHKLFAEVPAGYGTVGIRNAVLQGAGFAMNLLIKRGGGASLHDLFNALKPLQINYQDVSSGQQVATQHLNQSELMKMIGSTNLQQLLRPDNQNYKYAKFINAQISNAQPTVTLGVRSLHSAKPSTDSADQAAINSYAAVVASASAQVTSAAANTDVQNDPSIAASMSSAESTIQQASKSVHDDYDDLLASGQVSRNNASLEAARASSAAADVSGLVSAARGSANSASGAADRAVASASGSVSDMSSVASGASVDAVSASAAVKALTSLAGLVSAGVAEQMGNLLSQANGDANRISQFASVGQSTDQQMNSLLSDENSAEATGHYQTVLQKSAQLTKLDRDLDSQATSNAENVENLQNLVTAAKNLAVNPVNPIPQPNPGHNSNSGRSNSDNNKVYNDSNAIGKIDVIYVDSTNHVISTATVNGHVGDAFNLYDYTNQMPNGYHFDGVLVGANVQHFTNAPQDIIIEAMRVEPTSSGTSHSSNLASNSDTESSSVDPNANANAGNQDDNSVSASASGSDSGSQSNSVPSASSASQSAGSNSGKGGSANSPSGTDDPDNNVPQSPSDGQNSGHSTNGDSGGNSGVRNDGDNPNTDADNPDGNSTPTPANADPDSSSTVDNNNEANPSNDSGTTNGSLPQTGENYNLEKLGAALLAIAAIMTSLGIATDRRHQE